MILLGCKVCILISSFNTMEVSGLPISNQMQLTNNEPSRPFAQFRLHLLISLCHLYKVFIVLDLLSA